MVWILSQDKRKLVDAHEIEIRGNEGNFRFYCNGSNVGMYLSAEKTVDVMNELYEHIRNRTGICFNLYEGTGEGYECTKPFEMPDDEDEEVPEEENR